MSFQDQVEGIKAPASKTIDAFQGMDFGLILTVCDSARENCPWFPAEAERLHHDFPDPAKAQGTEAEIMEEFRRVRDMIKAYCRDLIDQLG